MEGSHSEIRGALPVRITRFGLYRFGLVRMVAPWGRVGVGAARISRRYPRWVIR